MVLSSPWLSPAGQGTPGRGQFDVSLQTRHRGHNKFRSLVFPLPYSATSTHARAMETESAETETRSVEDENFDQIFPSKIRKLSAQHWTPVRVAAEAARLLVRAP